MDEIEITHDHVPSFIEQLRQHTIGLDFDKQYKVMHKIGQGSYSKVYYGTSIMDHDRKFAIKVISKFPQKKNENFEEHAFEIYDEI